MPTTTTAATIGTTTSPPEALAGPGAADGEGDGDGLALGAGDALALALDEGAVVGEAVAMGEGVRAATVKWSVPRRMSPSSDTEVQRISYVPGASDGGTIRITVS
jgi:hypothetical protein